VSRVGDGLASSETGATKKDEKGEQIELHLAKEPHAQPPLLLAQVARMHRAAVNDRGYNLVEAHNDRCVHSGNLIDRK
jgi:hypothetical protein